MKNFALPAALALCFCLSACDPQSGITKKSLEKYQPTPTPEKYVPPPEVPIDPADIVTVDASDEGDQIFVSGVTAKKTVECKKYNKVMVNGDGQEVELKGACKQVMINGNQNKVVIVAASEVIFNGEENTLEYSKFINGKRPLITDNGSSSTAEKVSQPAKK